MHKGHGKTGWVKGVLTSSEGRFFISNANGDFEVDPDSIGEFTGHQIKGRKIFEKDVFVTNQDGPGVVLKQGGVHKVLFKGKSRFLADMVLSGDCQSIEGGSIENLKIILNQIKIK